VAPRHAEGQVLVTLTAPDGRQVTAAEPFVYYFGVDSDGDGLTDLQEKEGWDIWVDYFGIGLGVDTFGNFPGLYSITSDPTNPDTDGDGLDDRTEFLIISDPRKFDTDEDGLHDAEEVNRWLTSPISVDTDNDSRGTSGDLVPNTNFFDGAELGIDFDNDPTHTPTIDATSPTLADTDGDGRTDFEEYINPARSPLIADLPQVAIELEDAVDVRLNVEYAEEQGQSREYGDALTKSHTKESSFSYSAMFGVEVGFKWGIEAEGTAGLFQWGSAKQTFEAGVTFKHESTFTGTWGGSRTLQNEHIDYKTDAFTHTETASSGSMSAGVRISNPGNISYELDNLVFTVRHWTRGFDLQTGQLTGKFTTMATMSPALEGGITLAPGDSTPVLQVQADDVNVDRIKKFMEHPSTLYLETPYFNVETADGVNFAFLEEITQTRTAGLVIDFGDGDIERYTFATNVNRTSDGTLTGVNLHDFMTEYLEIPVVTTQEDLDGNPIPSKLVQVRGRPENGSNEQAAWILIGSNDDFDDPNMAFEDITLHRGDTAMLILVTDPDGDGLCDLEEGIYGTSEGDDGWDTDVDGLSDVDEVRAQTDPNGVTTEPGWMVRVHGKDTFHVVSDPQAADADGDGLDDLVERGGCEIDDLLNREYMNQTDCEANGGVWHPFAGEGCFCGDEASEDCSDEDNQADCEANGGVWTYFGTDPMGIDTDGDGLEDGEDPYPVTPARRFHVNIANPNPPTRDDPEPGLSWDAAFVDLQATLALVEALNTDGDPSNDIGEIWVAEGVYTPDPDATEGAYDQTAYFLLPEHAGIYGGFKGGEYKRGARESNPWLNNTILSGDLLGNDSAGEYGDNSQMILGAMPGTPPDPNDPNSVAILGGSHILDGFVIKGGRAPWNGGGLNFSFVNATLRNLLFVQNHTGSSGEGGAAKLYGCGSPDRPLAFINCNFVENSSRWGGALHTENSSVEFTECTFERNSAGQHGAGQSAGGAVMTNNWGIDGIVRFTRCLFRLNSTGQSGGALSISSGWAVADRCLFTQNYGGQYGGAVNISSQKSVLFSQCTFTRNDASVPPGYTGWGGAIYIWDGWIAHPYVYLVNCTVCDNSAERFGGIYAGGNGSAPPNLRIFNSIIYGNHDDIDWNTVEQEQIYVSEGPSYVFLDHSCLQALDQIGGGIANISPGPDDVKYKITGQGFAVLEEGSPCIDTGDSWVDADPLTPGLQLLPLTDLVNYPRWVDGDGDGFMEVDMGACEYQGGP
jgi:hypothetical protein